MSPVMMPCTDFCFLMRVRAFGFLLCCVLFLIMQIAFFGLSGALCITKSHRHSVSRPNLLCKSLYTSSICPTMSPTPNALFKIHLVMIRLVKYFQLIRFCEQIISCFCIIYICPFIILGEGVVEDSVKIIFQLCSYLMKLLRQN